MPTQNKLHPANSSLHIRSGIKLDGQKFGEQFAGKKTAKSKTECSNLYFSYLGLNVLAWFKCIGMQNSNKSGHFLNRTATAKVVQRKTNNGKK